MGIFLECKKAKRTGCGAAFLGGGMIAAAMPVVNMAVRSEMYVAQQGNPVQILLGANWQIMAMLNVLLVVAGACLLYQLEYSGNAMQKMKSLPIKESSVFFGKVMLIIFMSVMTLAIEAGAIAFCSYHWFQVSGPFLSGLCQNFGYAFLLMLPCVILSLLISEACRNMWISLGIGVVCTFTATMLPTDRLFLSLFPFAMPFQIFAGTDTEQAMHYMYAAAAEFCVLALAELIFLKVRRLFE